MSFSLPLEVLSAMQISFKVGLPDGKFGFDMVPTEPQGTANLHPPTGLKLHLRASRDCNGVILTVSTSGGSHSPSDGKASEYTLGGQSNGNVSSPASTHPFDLDFPLSCEDEHRTSGPSLLDSFLSETTETLNMYCDGPSVLGPREDVFRAQLPGLDTDNLLYCDDHQSNSGPAILDSFPAEMTETGNTYCDGPTALDHLLFQRMCLPPTDTILAHIEEVHNEKRTPNNQSTDSHQSPSDNIDIAQDFAFSAESDGTDSPLPTTPSTADSSRSSSPRPSWKLRRAAPPYSPYFIAKPTSPKHPKAKPTQVFPCTMGCALDFSRKHDRMRHEVSQHGRVCEWRCDICLGFFSSEATLRKHKCKISGGARRIGDKQGQVTSTV
ncbi:hypothetical protein DFH07DRAFT_1038625 [Mycena maculata]|uniref:C2H2-type domain-containing protein n=1 Tax=Mycena maculata TaxID=230809 RepID=A0AAD7N4I5_9AGAR|nr:hypothetical protein DFH07DRAFT_1038625 [Mycena maculata]